MKRFKCTFIKESKVFQAIKDEPAQFIEQEYITNQDGITVIGPAGYKLVAIVEYLPQVNQCKNEKLPDNNN